MKKLKNYKSMIILLGAIILGGIVGLIWGEGASVLSPFGDLFLNMLLIVVVPLIFLTITGSIYKMREPKRIGKILVTTFLVFLMTSVVAVLIGIVSTYSFKLVDTKNGEQIKASLVMDDEVAYEWARIPHFYSPFYVYVYATGYTSAVALSEGILKEGEPAVKKYLEFLSMGGSADPLDELRHGGVDLTTPAPIQKALDKFRRVLDDAEETYAQLQNK